MSEPIHALRTWLETRCGMENQGTKHMSFSWTDNHDLVTCRECQVDLLGFDKTRVLALADRISKIGNAAFNMRRCFHACGTPACLAGHTAAMAGFTEREILAKSPCDTLVVAREHLMMDQRIAVNLFTPAAPDPILSPGMCEPLPGVGVFDYRAKPKTPGRITRNHAVRCLRKLVETGGVDWEGTAKRVR